MKHCYTVFKQMRLGEKEGEPYPETKVVTKVRDASLTRRWALETEPEIGDHRQTRTENQRWGPKLVRTKANGCERVERPGPHDLRKFRTTIKRREESDSGKRSVNLKIGTENS